MDIGLDVIRLAMAGVFGMAGVAKLTDRAGFLRALREFGAPARLVAPLAVAVPLVELGVAAALLLPRVAWWAAAAATVLLVAFMVVIGVSLARGRAPDCNCFGRFSATSIGRKTLVRNGVFAAAAGVVLVAGPSRTGASALDWVGTLGAAQQVGLAGGVIIAGLLASHAWLLIHLVRQNGRLLDRMAVVEHTLNIAPWQRDLLPLAGGNGNGHGGNGHHNHGHRQAGLPVGEAAPAVRLPDLDGAEVDLAAAERPTVLLFWSPTCGFCQQMLPDLKAWDAGRPADVPRLVVISTGSPEDNRALGLSAPVLLDEGFATGQAYGANGTPQAVLVNADSTIGAPLAAGAQAVMRLLATELSRA